MNRSFQFKALLTLNAIPIGFFHYWFFFRFAIFYYISTDDIRLQFIDAVEIIYFFQSVHYIKRQSTIHIFRPKYFIQKMGVNVFRRVCFQNWKFKLHWYISTLIEVSFLYKICIVILLSLNSWSNDNCGCQLCKEMFSKVLIINSSFPYWERMRQIDINIYAHADTLTLKVS